MPKAQMGKILVGQKEVEYEVVRCRRRSIGIRAVGANRLVLRVPFSYSLKKLEELLSKETKTLERLLRQYAAYEAEAKQADRIDTIYLWGTGIPAHIVSQDPAGAARSRESIEIGMSQITVKTAEPENIPHIKTLLVKAFGKFLLPECKRINETVCEAFRRAGYSVPLARVTIKNMKSRWGSCKASDGKISINLRLVHFPPECLESVFYHEYVHFLCQDHSARFYDLLYQFYPDYDSVQRPLKKETLKYCGWY